MNNAAAENPPVKPPVTANFPDPRKGREKPSLRSSQSVDAILQRTDPEKRSVSDLVYLGVEDSIAELEAEESALQDRERELAKVKAETDERMRVVKETEILLAAREKVIAERETMLAQRLSNSTPDKDMAALDKALKETRETLNRANEAIAEKEGIIGSLRSEMEELKAKANRSEESGGDANGPVTSYDEVAHKSLADQVAFLREREAFIEESENTLFNKAQELQEWETQLQQDAHDQESAHQADNTKADEQEITPIAFPRSAASC